MKMEMGESGGWDEEWAPRWIRPRGNHLICRMFSGCLRPGAEGCPPTVGLSGWPRSLGHWLGQRD